MLAVSDGSAAIKFYQAAFGTELLWHLGDGADVVAGLAIGGAKFFLAHESPEYGTRGPASAGFTTVRIELFVDDPLAVHRQALTRGLWITARWKNTRTKPTGPARSNACSKALS
jgi:uncharacterized glyoxalase superfamily protein PhnB